MNIVKATKHLSDILGIPNLKIVDINNSTIVVFNKFTSEDKVVEISLHVLVPENKFIDVMCKAKEILTNYNE